MIVVLDSRTGDVAVLVQVAAELADCAVPPQDFQYIDPYSFLDNLGMNETLES